MRVFIFRILIWADHVARMEEDKSAFNTLTATPKGNKFYEKVRKY